MKIWTVEYKAKYVSYATEKVLYEQVSKILTNFLNETYKDYNDPIYRAINFLIKSGEQKLAFEVCERFRSSGVRIIEQELIGHVME